jgi:large subunit ribosomal protein L35Ae
MKALISNFRQSRTRQTNNHMILIATGVNTRKKAQELVGKKVVFKTESGKELIGKIAGAHGNSGAFRAIFETGMPGQSLSKQVEIL